jgi:hypothetical protein
MLGRDSFPQYLHQEALLLFDPAVHEVAVCWNRQAKLTGYLLDNGARGERRDLCRDFFCRYLTGLVPRSSPDQG